MKTLKVLGIATPLALLLGTALPAQAQQIRTFFEDFGCALDTDELVANGVVPAGTFEEGGSLIGFISEKNCPGSQQNPAIQMTCTIPLDPDVTLNFSTRNFTCVINGAQCGFNQSFEASNRRLTFEPGLATIRCSRSVD